MRVFVTGATGFIGEAVVKELLQAGHQVLGLARSDASAAKLQEWGATVHRGELNDLESLASGARESDGVIHTAFVHDFSAYATAAETDRMAIGAIIQAVEGTGKPFVSTSGIALLAQGQLGTEDQLPEPTSAGSHRAEAEKMVMEGAKKGVRTSVIRLAPSVHGRGDHGFVPALIGMAKAKGMVAYIGDGSNRWPALHRLDAARLYRLALEKAPPATMLHGVAEEGITMSRIAAAIGEGLQLPAGSITLEQAAEHFGWLAAFAGSDSPASSKMTRDLLGWLPKEQDLLTDIRESGYLS